MTEGIDRIVDKLGEAKVVQGEEEDGMDVSVEARSVGGKDRDGLRNRNKLSRLYLDGAVYHTGRGIIAGLH